MLLEVRDIWLRFGGLVALEAVTIKVGQGEVVGVIGPNGAGKTCLLNCVCGIYRPQEGKILLDGIDITGKSPEEIAKLGVGRTFQHGELFEHLTVQENVLIGRHNQIKTSIWEEALMTQRVQREEQRQQKEVMELLETLGLEKYIWQQVSRLPVGIRKLIDLARALALEPKLLLVDEVSAGMVWSEKGKLGELIKDLTKKLKIGVLWIEHDMQLVGRYCERIYALDRGKVIADGKPEQVLNCREVREAYFGEAIF